METYQDGLGFEVESPVGRTWTARSLGREMAGGFLELVCTLGLRAAGQLFEEEVEGVVGPKGRHNPERQAVRHGYDDGEVTLGGRRLSIRRPRMRWRGGAEIPLETYRWAAGRDVLNRTTRERLLAGVSTRNYTLTLEPVAARAAHRPRSVSKSSVSRRFVALTRVSLDALLSRPLAEIKPVVLMIDGLHVAGRMLIAAMVIDIDGRKIPVGLREGATENGRVVTDLLADLVERGLDSSCGLLVVIDGGKALASAVRKTFGAQAKIQRCVEHKVRNVQDYLHKEERSWVSRTIRQAVKRQDATLAQRDLEALARRLEQTNIDAARSLREGMDEMLTIHRLGVGQILARTLRTTNALESMNEIIRARTRNVKRWRDGDMRERWIAAAMLEAESQFRRVEGYCEIPALARALYHATVLKQDRTDPGSDPGVAA
jgi:putative transposase